MYEAQTATIGVQDSAIQEEKWMVRVHIMLSSSNQEPQWLQFRGITSRNWISRSSAGCRYHRLLYLYNLLDVAAIAGLMWGHPLGSAQSVAVADSIKYVRGET